MIDWVPGLVNRRRRLEGLRKDITVANNYTQFSQGIDHVTPEERAWIENQLDPDHWRDTPPKWDAPVEDGQVACEWSLDPSSPHRELGEVESFFWVHEDSGDPEQVSAFIRAFLAKFQPDDHFVLTYAETCSSPRLGEFSGGAIIVTRDEIRRLSVYDWVEHEVASLRRSRLPSALVHPDPATESDDRSIREQ